MTSSIKYLSLVILWLFGISCNDMESDIIEEDLDHIKGTPLIQQLPEVYQSVGLKKVWYTDSLAIKYLADLEVTKKIDTISTNPLRTIEHHYAIIKIPEKGIVVSLAAYGSINKDKGIEYMYIYMNTSDGFTFNPFGIINFYFYDWNKKAMRSKPHFNTLTIFGRTFKNVYSDMVNNAETQRDRFNFDVGIVSFEDRYRRLYVFDSFQ